MYWTEDLRSKIIDGLVAALSLYLYLVLLVLLIRPVEAALGRPGLLIYTLILIAISVYCLEHSLLQRVYEVVRAWYGLIGGLTAWTAISLSNDLGTRNITSVTGILLLILITLTVTRLWRRSLPPGGRYYSLTLLLAWTGQLILDGEPYLIDRYPLAASIYLVLPYLAIFGSVLCAWWILTQTEWRLQRLTIAPLLAFFVVIAAYLLR